MFLRITDKYYVSKLLILRAHAFTFFVVEKKQGGEIRSYKTVNEKTA